MAADHDEIAVRQKPVEIRGAPHFTEPRRKGFIGARVASGADDPHADSGAEPADIAADAAGADDAGGLAFDQKRPIGTVVEGAGAAIEDGAVEALGEMQNPGQRVFRHRQGAADAARRGHGDIAAPEVAAQQVAGAGRALVKPFEPRRPGTQVERERPAAEDHLGVGEEAVALLAGARADRTRPQIARSGVGRPGLPIFAVEPASGIGQSDRRIDRLDLLPILGAEALNYENVDPSHGLFPDQVAAQACTITSGARLVPAALRSLC